jgi:peptide/nickel transport system substrate-binding protein
MRIRHVLVALATLSLLFAGMAQAQTRLVVGNISEAVNLDPRLVNDVYSFQRIYTIYEPLIAFEKDLSYIPRLATDWSFSEDGSVITFQLREGVLWHHGTEFTSADVKYTIDWLLNPDNAAPTASNWASIAEVTTPDPYTVVFHIDPVNVWIFNMLARTPIVPADRGDESGFATNPSGTGPWELVEWVRDDRMVLRRFEDHWETERGNVDELVFRTIGEDAARLLAFEAGEIDLYQGQVVPVEVPRLEAETPWVTRIGGLGHTYWGFNTRHPILADARVRQALNHLIPGEAIVQRLYSNVGTAGVSPVSPDSAYFSPTTPRYPYDPERARALLAEAGYADGFSVRLHVGSNQAVRVQVAEVLQYEAAQVGVDVQIHAEEFATMLPRIQTEPYDFDTYILGWAGNVDPDYALFPMFHSTGSSNYIGYSNPRFDELIELGRRLAPGSPESIAAYREAQDLLMTEVPYAFIINSTEIGLVQEWIEGWGVHPNASVTFHDLHKVVKNR